MNASHSLMSYKMEMVVMQRQPENPLSIVCNTRLLHVLIPSNPHNLSDGYFYPRCTNEEKLDPKG